MARSIKKGPFVDAPPAWPRWRRRARSTTRSRSRPGRAAPPITPDFVGLTVAVHNGKAAHPGLRVGKHGRPQARRIRADAHLQGPFGRQEGRGTRAAEEEVRSQTMETNAIAARRSPVGPEGSAGRRPDPRPAGRPARSTCSTFSPKKGAKIIKKVLESAIANAEHNDGADIDELKVKTIYIDKAETLQAHQRARQGPRQRHRQAELPHPRRRRRRKLEEYRSWDRKSHPTGFRLSVNAELGRRSGTRTARTSRRRWTRTSRVREYLGKKLSHASVGKITIERPAKNARITIHSARPGVVIGKKGEDIETLRGRPAQDDGRRRRASTSRKSASRKSMRS